MPVLYLFLDILKSGKLVFVFPFAHLDDKPVYIHRHLLRLVRDYLQVVLPCEKPGIFYRLCKTYSILEGRFFLIRVARYYRQERDRYVPEFLKHGPAVIYNKDLPFHVKQGKRLSLADMYEEPVREF